MPRYPCPRCREAIEVENPFLILDLKMTCPACGSHIKLVYETDLHYSTFEPMSAAYRFELGEEEE